MAKLLISVRNAAEADEAVAGGAQWVDVKQPDAGALGMPSPSDLSAVARQIPHSIPLSVAIGELREWGDIGGLRSLPLAGVGRVKLGLSECRFANDWQAQLRRFAQALPAETSLVGVIYADWSTCDAPAPAELLAAASEVPFSTLLVDTYDKTAGALFDWMPPEELAELFTAAQRSGLTCVAAGSLRGDQLALAARCGADVVAVRGAACLRNVRTAIICRQQVAKLRSLLDEFSTATLL